jgi:hypothetical protein
MDLMDAAILTHRMVHLKGVKKPRGDAAAIRTSERVKGNLKARSLEFQAKTIEKRHSVYSQLKPMLPIFRRMQKRFGSTKPAAFSTPILVPKV